MEKPLNENASENATDLRQPTDKIKDCPSIYLFDSDDDSGTGSCIPGNCSEI